MVYDLCKQGRLHTNITNLETSCRQFLKFNGQSLVNLDVRNSHPLIFASLILNCITHDGFLGSVHSFTTEVQKCRKSQDLNVIPRTKISPETLNPFPSLSTTSHNPLYDETKWDTGKIGKDVEDYIELTQKGEFYNFLMREENFPEDESLRRQFKSNFFGEVFYCKSNHEGKSALPFRRHFPTAYEILTRLKTRDYKCPSLAIMRAESDIIINRAVRSLMEAHSTIPVWTIHDSIMTTPDNACIVKQAMMAAFSSVGLAPTIKVSPA